MVRYFQSVTGKNILKIGVCGTLTIASANQQFWLHDSAHLLQQPTKNILHTLDL